ncbi:hypothetical protein Tco_0718957, partial [Tanacetum coccineum]
APLADEELEVLEPSDTRITSSHTSASSDSTSPLLPDHLLTQALPTPTPTRVLFHRKAAHMARYRSSYETSSSSSPPALPIRKRYRGTSELVEDTEDESLDSSTEREGSEGDGHGSEDEGHGSEDEGPSSEKEGPGTEEEEEEVAPKDLEDGRVYTDIPTYVAPPAPVETPPSPERSSGSLPVSPLPLIVPSPIASPVTTPTATISVDEDQFLKLYTRSGAVRDEIFSQRYRFRSLEREQERATMTFSVIWRENHDLRRQIAEERRERLELTDHVARTERRRESRGE